MKTPTQRIQWLRDNLQLEDLKGMQRTFDQACTRAALSQDNARLVKATEALHEVDQAIICKTGGCTAPCNICTQ